MTMDLHAFASVVSSVPNEYNHAYLTVNGASGGIMVGGMGQVEPAQTNPAENRAIRSALCQALVESGKCQAETLQALMARLGFGRGAEAGAMDQALTMGEVKSILSEVDAAPVRSANKQERFGFMGQLEADGLLSGQGVKGEVERRLGLQPSGDLSQKLTEQLKEDVRGYCLSSVMKQRLGSDLEDMFIGNMRGAQLSGAVMSSLVNAFREAKTGGDVGRIIALYHHEIIKQPSLFMADAERGLAELTQQTGVDFLSQKEEIAKRFLKSLDNQYRSSECPKLETLKGLKEAFCKKLKTFCEAKRAMCEAYEGAKGTLGAKGREALMAIVKDCKFRDAECFRQIIAHRDFGHGMLDLMQKQGVTEGEIMAEAKRLTQERLAFFNDAIKQHAGGGEEFGASDKTSYENMCKSFSRACWLDSHGQEGLTAPWNSTLDNLKRFAGVVDVLAQQVALLSGEYKAHAQIVRSGEDPSLDEINVASLQRDLIRCIDDLCLPRECSLFCDDCDELKEQEAYEGAVKQLTQEEVNYLNEEMGFGIKRSHNAGAFKQFGSLRLDDMVMEKLQEDVSKGDASTEENDEAIWEQYAMDLRRTSYGADIEINGRTYHNAPYDKADYSSEMEGNRQISHDLGHVFGADTVNGKKAARILSRIVHQGFHGLVMENLSKLDEPIKGILNDFTATCSKCKIVKQSDGSYDVDLDEEHHFGSALDMTNGEFTHFSNDTCINFSFKYKLSFDETGRPTLTQRGRSVLECNVKKLTLSEEEQRDLWRHLDSAKFDSSQGIREFIFNEPELLNSPQLKQKLNACRELQHSRNEADLQALAARQQELYEFVSSRVLNSEQANMLKAVGVPGMTVKLMLGGNRHGIKKALVDDLVSGDEQRVTAALQRLTASLQALKDEGVTEIVPQLDRRFIALYTVLRLDVKGDKSSPSDMELATSFLKSRDGADVLEKLNSKTSATVDEAKRIIKGKLTEMRRAQGIQVLRKHSFTGDDVTALQSNDNSLDMAELLEHVYARDDQMDEALKALRAETNRLRKRH